MAARSHWIDEAGQPHKGYQFDLAIRDERGSTHGRELNVYIAEAHIERLGGDLQQIAALLALRLYDYYVEHGNMPRATRELLEQFSDGSHGDG